MTIFSQEIKLELQCGVGTYSMSDLKMFDLQVLQQVHLPLVQTENFPPYAFIKGAVMYGINSMFNVGPIYSFNSTGSRYSLSDYSGSYYYEDLVQAHSVGISFVYYRETHMRITLGAYIDGGVSFSQVQFTQHFELDEIDIEEANHVFANETRYFIEPGIRLGYPIKNIEPGVVMGYNIPLGNNGLEEKDSEQILYLRNGDKVNSDWNGFRVSFSIAYKFSRKED